MRAMKPDDKETVNRWVQLGASVVAMMASVSSGQGRTFSAVSPATLSRREPPAWPR